MRVYPPVRFAASAAGAWQGGKICQRLQQLGHELLTTHLLADDVDRAEAELTEEQVYRRDLDWLSSCDVLVAEASRSSYAVGFEVGHSIGRSPAYRLAFRTFSKI